MTHQSNDSEPSSTFSSRCHNRACVNVWAVVLFVVVAVLAGGSDLWTKHLAFERLNHDESLQPRVADVLEEHFGTTQPADPTPELTRWVFQDLHITKRICFGLSITLSTNPGVVFGVRWFPLWLVNAITICMLLFVTGFFLYSPKRHYWLHAALALLLGGAFGNLYDRLASSVVLPTLPPIRYHVRDFIDCSDLGYRWVFNLSDAWLVIGVGMIIVYWLWTGRKDRQAAMTKKK